jgi:GT2 family glycosyltransferase
VAPDAREAALVSDDEAIAVIVVTHDSRAEIAALAASVCAQLGPADRLIVVDNASSDGTAAFARALDPRIAVLESAENRGFAAGSRLGVERSTQPLILLLNPDAQLEPGALERLRATAGERRDWSAWQAAVMLPDGRVNTSGGVVHYLGIAWAGQCERDASVLAAAPYEAAFPSGAALMIRRSAWLELDGFEDGFFLYCEDVDLGLRLWLSGHRVGVEPRARVVHGYSFDKGPRKWFLLERNRWRVVLATYPAPLLAAVLPVLLASEIGLLAIAARDGWLAPKLRAQAATLAGLPAIARRRRAVQRTRRVGAADFAAHLTASLESSQLALPRGLAALQSAYWRCVCGLLV